MNRQEALAALKGKDSTKIIEGLTFVREQGDNELLELALIVFRDTNDNDIKSEVINLINDLRNKDCKPVIIKALTDDSFSAVCKYIISSCWQNSIDFSDNIMLFIDMFATCDFETGIEIFSVVDDSFDEISADERDRISEKLNNMLPGISDSNKRSLLVELQKLIKE